MTRFCFCLIALLVCSSTAEAQFRRFAKPRTQRSAPLKNATEMVSSILAEELTKMLMKGMAEQLISTMEKEGIKMSKVINGLDHPKVDITTDPNILLWTQIHTKSPENKDSGTIFLIPTAKLSQSEVAKLAPGSIHFVGAIGFDPDILPETKPWVGQEDRLYTFTDHPDPYSLLADMSVMLLAIGKNPDGQLRLLGYGPDPQPIFNAEVSIVDSAGGSKKKEGPDKTVTIEKNKALRYEVLRPFTREGKSIDHFLRVDVVEREPLKLQIDLFGKYRVRF